MSKIFNESERKALSTLFNTEKEFEYFNYVTTYISNKKTIHVAFSEKGEEREGTDFIIQNYLDLPIFIEKSNEEVSGLIIFFSL